MTDEASLKKILIIGSTGQIGRALAKKFLSLGSECRFQIIEASRHCEPNQNHQKISLDLSNLDSIAAVVHAVGPDLLINASAYTDVERAEDEPIEADLLNHLAVRELGRVSGRLKIPVIHFSTDYVYAGTGSVPQTENNTLDPLSVYAKTKLAGEQALARENSQYLIFRTSWIYDARGKNFPRTILRHATNKAQLKIVNDQFGAPTSARAVADAVCHVVDKLLPQLSDNRTEPSCFGTYNLSCNGYCSWFEFAEAIVLAAQRHGLPLAVRELIPVPCSEYPTKARRPLNSRLDLTKFETQFDHKMPDWREEWFDLAAEVVASIGAT